jgi:hypothetical protein
MYRRFFITLKNKIMSACNFNINFSADKTEVLAKAKP